MEFTFETQYTAGNLTVMAKVLRKTAGKKHNRRTRVFGWAAMILALLLLSAKGFPLTPRTFVLSAAALVLLAALLLEDRINGYAAQKRLLPGTETARAVFSEHGFTSVTEAGRSEWRYDAVTAIAETDGFFVFLFDRHHAQLYDKRRLQGGTPEDFRRFIEAATGLRICSVR